MIKFQIKNGNCLFVSIHTDINFETGRDLEVEVKEFKVESEITTITIDLSDVRFIDSTGISLLIKWLYPLSTNCEVTISGASEPIKNILRISKIDTFVNVK